MCPAQKKMFKGCAVMGMQAQAAADIGDYETAEALWVRAQLPQQALDMLRAASRWAEAVAFAQRHLPDQVSTPQHLPTFLSSGAFITFLAVPWRQHVKLCIA